MSSAPSDLATTFRSIPRRRSGAEHDVDPAVVAGFGEQIDQLISRAADMMGCQPDPATVAQTIERRPANSWSDQALSELSAITLSIGAILRSIEALGDQDQE